MTTTKGDLINRISESAGANRTLVKNVICQFFDEVISELGKGNRLEFRDFGVFETRVFRARLAQSRRR